MQAPLDRPQFGAGEGQVKLSQVSSMPERIDGEIVGDEGRELLSARAHEAIKGFAAAKVIEAWDEPRHEEFRSRTAWSLFNAFTEVQ